MTSRRVAAAVLAVVTAAALLTGCSGDTSTAVPSRTEITALLTRHGHDVLDRDRAAFLSDLAPGRYRTRQSTVLANLGKLPLAHWSYAIGAAVDDAGVQKTVRKKYGRSAVVVAVTLSFALRGIDTAPVEHDLWWTFVRRGGGVRIINDTDLAGAGGISWQGPWDFGPIDVVRGVSSLVIGHADNFGVLAAASAIADAAVPVVTSVWGAAWSRQVLIEVPSTPTELTSALGPEASVTAPVGAIARSDGTDPTTGTVLGQRLVVEPAPFDRLSAVGRQIVLQHEITHIASAAATTDASPRWLVEGFAEYVGNLGSGQTVKQAAIELGRDVRRGRVPVTLPTPAAFDAPATAAQAYQESWLACRLVAGQVGAAGLVRFYRAIGDSRQTGAEPVTAALAAVLHQTPARFEARLRTYVRSQLT